MAQPPLIVIPGEFGSQLRRRSTVEEIWPRSNLSLLFSSNPDIELEINPETLDPVISDVEAFDVFRQGLGQDFYGKVLETLENIGGYQRGYIDDAGERRDRTYYVYTYDWRLDNVAAVQGLHELIGLAPTCEGLHAPLGHLGRHLQQAFGRLKVVYTMDGCDDI